MRYEIDLENITTKMQFHEKIRETIPCPDYYGGNLDALYDVLTEIGTDTQIILENPAAVVEHLGRYGEAMLSTMQEAAENNPHLIIMLR